MKRVKVSNNVIRRLPRYLRKLDDLMAGGISRISSKELGVQLGLTPSQIRQDFSCFGEFGQQGYGYNVPALREQIASILGMDRGFRAILDGELDDVPEQAFFNVGTIDDVRKKAETL